MKQLYIVGTAALTAAVFFCSSPERSAPLTSFLLNGKEITLADGDYAVRNDVLYLSASALEKHLALEFKDIVPGKQIGMCRADLCIPLEVGENDERKAFKDGDDYYVPLVFLMESLGDEAVWDPVRRTVSVKTTETDNSINFKQVGASDVSMPVDFSLPDFDGNTVSLSDFSGKKVAVFFWASW